VAPVGVKFLLRFVYEMPRVLFTTRITHSTRRDSTGPEHAWEIPEPSLGRTPR